MVLGLVLRVSLATPSTAAKTPPACGVAGLRQRFRNEDC